MASHWYDTNANLLNNFFRNFDHFDNIVIEIQPLPLTKMHMKMPSARWLPFYIGLDMFHAWSS